MLDSRRIDRFLFAEYETAPSSLALYRILYAACILAVYLPRHLWIQSFPGSFFNPPIGFTMFFSDFPPQGFFIALNCCSIIAAVCLLVGFRTRLVSVVLGVSLLAGNAWSYSFGKIDHDILIVVLPLLLQFSGWGDRYSVDVPRTPATDPSARAWPLALLALLIGCAMMTAAYAKATTGWLDLRTHAVLGHLAHNVFVTGRLTWLTGPFLRLRSEAFWELQDWATILLEASFVVAVVNRHAFRIVCALACFFHLGIALTMGIPFWTNVLAYGAFCDWSALESRGAVATGLGAWSSIVSRLSGTRVLLLGAGISALYLTVGNPVHAIAQHVGPEPEAAVGYPVIGIAAVVAGFYLLAEIRALITHRPAAS